MDLHALMAAMRHDKKGNEGAVRIVGLHGPGLPELGKADARVLEAGWAAVRG